MSTEREGMTQLFTKTLKVTIDEMKDWTPERITKFMGGLAKIQAAGTEDKS